MDLGVAIAFIWPNGSGNGSSPDVASTLRSMSDTRLQWLLDDELLVCPTCGAAGRFRQDDEALRCEACGRAVPVSGGVPDFFNGYLDAGEDTASDPSAATRADPTVIDEIASILDLPDNEDVRAAIATALRTADRDTDHPALTAEIKEVHARFVGGEVELPPVPNQANLDPMVVIERHYTPTGFVAGERRFINVRLRNAGTTAWSSRTRPVALTAAARFHRRSFGRWSATATTYTPFPIDIEPERAITLPIEIDVPSKLGRHELELGLFHHPNGFVAGSTIRVPVEIHARPHPDTRPTSGVIDERPTLPSYGEDHEVANQMVDAALDQRWPNSQRRLVEIGGSTHPQSWNHPRSNLVNVDISSPTLQLGVLFDQHHDRSIAHLCADATELPLAPASFHAVTMYATLHHFPEPERLLRSAADLLLPNGFVAVMCEPTASSLAHPAAVRDLLGGINEQTFAPDEYLWMADRAGLRVVDAVDHGGSFKAILSAA